MPGPGMFMGPVPGGMTEEEREKKRLEERTVAAELTIDLEYLAQSYGLTEPYDFEIGSSILGSALIIRGRRPRRK